MLEGVILNGVKNPEYIRPIKVAITLWILRYAQNDRPYFQLR